MIAPSIFNLQDVIKKYEGYATHIKQVPHFIKMDLLGDGDNGGSFYTLLKEGKDWTYEYTARYQPRTAKILLSGGEFVLLWQRIIRDLIQEVNGQIIQIRRPYAGPNPCDPEFAQDERNKNSRFYSLPEPIRMAYYYRFDGLNVPDHPVFSIYTRLLPYPIGRPWQSIDRYLGSLRLKKKYLPLVEEMIPGIKPTDKDMPYVDFMRFLDSRPHGGKEGDVFFVKNHIQDGIIYYIRDGDVPNMSILENPAEAIDLYCEHVLLRKEGRFDFRPWAVPFRPVAL